MIYRYDLPVAHHEPPSSQLLFRVRDQLFSVVGHWFNSCQELRIIFFFDILYARDRTKYSNCFFFHDITNNNYNNNTFIQVSIKKNIAVKTTNWGHYMYLFEQKRKWPKMK